MTNVGMFKDMTYDSLNKQIDGTHYKNMKVQPAHFINENKLLFAEGNAIKYICRHHLKGKKKDIEKAIHYLEMILERDYSDEPKESWLEGFRKWKHASLHKTKSRK